MFWSQGIEGASLGNGGTNLAPLDPHANSCHPLFCPGALAPSLNPPLAFCPLTGSLLFTGLYPLLPKSSALTEALFSPSPHCSVGPMSLRISNLRDTNKHFLEGWCCRGC